MYSRHTAELKAWLAPGVAVLFFSLFFSANAAAASPSRTPAGPEKSKSGNKLAADTMQLLQANCIPCHNPEKHKGGLQLSTQAAALKGADSGKVLMPGKPEKSNLLKVLAADSDPHMPPKGQLSAAEIDLVRKWITAGAPWDVATLAKLQKPRMVVLNKLPESFSPAGATAVSLDGTRAAVARGNQILIYDLASTNFALIRGFEGHKELVRALCWSPDGQRLASGSYRELKVWEANGERVAWTVNSNLVGQITALRFSPFGGALIAADSVPAQSGWVRLFNPDSGAAVAAWQAHTDTINDLSITAEGGLLATAGSDKLIKLWELVSQKEVAKLEGHSGAVRGVAFNPTVSEMVSVGADKQLKVWDIKTRESVVTMGGRKYGLNAVAWSENGKVVVAGDDDGRVYSFTDFKRHTGEQSSSTASERQLERWAAPVTSVAINADGSRILAGDFQGLSHLMNNTGKLLAAFGTNQIADLSLTNAPPSTGTLSVPSTPSFVHDVLPMLAKAGCSAGSCHAKQEGQNGFKLSVFNYDPQSDYHEIVRKDRSRRIFPAAPEESLILLKPTLTIDHGGGKRFDANSETYRTLVQWIRGGMPYQHTNEATLVKISVEPTEQSYRKGVTQPLKVEALYSDGAKRDVTRLADYSASEKEIVKVNEEGKMQIGSLSGEAVVVARFMGLVSASHVTVPADRSLPDGMYASLRTNNFIDTLAYAQFRKMGLYPSDLCSDAEFFRRASLDAIGVLPSLGDTRAYLADNDPDKRRKWIDQLLARPAYADYWANKWADLLRPNPDRVGVKSVFVLDQWLRESFRANKPYDQLAREIVLAEGSNHRDGPTVIYRDRREPSEITTLFSQIFLGVRMECAKCHHHPNEKWSQNDFYQFAAFFGSVKQKGAGLSPPISAGTETFYYASGGSVKHPVTDEVMKPCAPGMEPPEGLSEKSDPRTALANWLDDPKNPFFAKAAVNRVWAALFGRGFVEPVDDFRMSNPISNEPLLDALAQDFVRHGYDLKHLIRTIMQSRIYQLSSTPNEFNLADTKNFSRSYRRRLPAEVMVDAVSDVTGVPDDYSGCPPGTRATQTWSYKIQSQFMDAFGRPNPSTDCPCERDLRTSVVQSLHLMNSKGLQAKLANAEGRVHKLADSKMSPEEIVNELYLVAYNRPPQPPELKSAVAAFDAPKVTRQTATEDVLWALLNSAEFVFNH